MLFIYLFSSLLLLASGTLSINVNFYVGQSGIEPLHPVTLSCEITNYYPGAANYSVAFYRGHSLNNRNLIGKHDVYSLTKNQHSIIFSAGKFLDAEAHSGHYYSLPRFELLFQPKANLTSYENYWCELIEQSHQPALTHTSNVYTPKPTVFFTMNSRGTPITATCTISNFNASSFPEYSVVFYNADSRLPTSRIYHLGTYHVRFNAETEFIPDSTQPEVTVHGNHFQFPVFEVTIDRRFTINIIYYCALELGPVGGSGQKYKSNTING